jgi:hypothetical protein
MKSVEDLPRTTFSGRRFTRKQLAQVQDLVQTFKNLSRKELAYTICEQLSWKSPNGKIKVQAGLKLLEDLEKQEIITLPAKREQRKRQSRKPAFTEKPNTSPVEGKLGSIGPIKLERVISVEDRENWKAYIEEYHYLGYKQPVGAQIGYLVVSEA